MNSTLRVLLFVAAMLIGVCGASAAEPGSAATPAPNPSAASAKGFHLENPYDDTYQFIFFAALEGLYRDGVSGSDVDSLLATKGKNGGYLNFIYTCPICDPVQSAIVTYKIRPKIDRYKWSNYQTDEHTFGVGLPPEISADLRSEKASIRLTAVNNLVSKWISYRMDHASLTDDQRKALIEELKKRRKKGMEALQSFARQGHGPDSMKTFAAGYEGEGDECAICNAALQMPLKLKNPPAGK